LVRVVDLIDGELERRPAVVNDLVCCANVLRADQLGLQDELDRALAEDHSLIAAELVEGVLAIPIRSLAVEQVMHQPFDAASGVP